MDKTVFAPARKNSVYGIECQESLPDGTFLIGYRTPDLDTPNPCEDCDGFGKIRSLNTRHENSISLSEAKQFLKDKMVVPLSYYEHSNCLWDVLNGERISACPDKQWDQVQFAGVWIPDQSCREEIKRRSQSVKGKRYHDIARELAATCCKIYTDWVNGFNYTNVIEICSSTGELIKEISVVGGYTGEEFSKECLDNDFKNQVTLLRTAWQIKHKKI